MADGAVQVEASGDVGSFFGKLGDTFSEAVSQTKVGIAKLSVETALKELGTHIAAQGGFAQQMSGFIPLKGDANTDFTDQTRESLASAVALLKQQAGIEPANGHYDSSMRADLEKAILAKPDLVKAFTQNDDPSTAPERLGQLLNQLDVLEKADILYNSEKFGKEHALSVTAGGEMMDILSMFLKILIDAFPALEGLLNPVIDIMGGPPTNASGGVIDVSKPLTEDTISTLYDTFKNPNSVISKITGLLPDKIKIPILEEIRLMDDALTEAYAAAGKLPEDATLDERKAAFGQSLQTSINEFRDPNFTLEQAKPTVEQPVEKPEITTEICAQFKDVSAIEIGGATTFAFTASGLALTEKQLELKEACADLTGTPTPSETLPANDLDNTHDKSAEADALTR